MIQVGTILKVCDKTGVMLVQCIKVLGDAKKKIAFLGDVILVSVQRINPKKFEDVKLFKRKRFFLGTMHRALIVRAKVNFSRLPGIFIKFNENSVVLVNKRTVPISNRVYGPILRELCMRWPSLGCVTRMMI
jgi:large subunit ribosomal protein L14